jgi:hypothetical protein
MGMGDQPEDKTEATGPFVIGKLARDGVEALTSVVYGENLSRPTNMATTPAPEQSSEGNRGLSYAQVISPCRNTTGRVPSPPAVEG